MKSPSYFDGKPVGGFVNCSEDLRGFVPGAVIWTTAHSGGGKSLFLELAESDSPYDNCECGRKGCCGELCCACPFYYPEESVDDECQACDGLGGHACTYCDDDKVCVHYVMCTVCEGSGFTF